MSAWVDAIYYRPGPPPVITPSSLADFVEQLLAIDTRDADTLLRAELKFGKSVDQDDEDTVIYDDPEATVTLVRSIEWDAEIETKSPNELLRWLRSPFRKKGLFARTIKDPIIYRAMVDLGGFKEDVNNEFCREYDEVDELPGLFLNNFFVEIAPVKVGDPQGDGTLYHVGWIAVSASGQGYIWPWTYEETLARIRASEPLQRVCELCKSFWPVPPIELRPEHIEIRKRAGHLWGGDDYDAPPDWRWVINESY